MRIAAPIALAVALTAAGAQDEKMAIPSSITEEHQHLHRELVAITKMEGDVGKAGREVAAKLHEHFEAEEAYALPPLGLLVPLSKGTVTEDMRSALAMTEKLRENLPKMLKEHEEIVAALKKLKAAAQAAGKPEVERFVEKLMLHAKNEEEVLYPAALLVGELLKLKLK